VARSRRVTVKTHDLDGKPFEFEATGFLAIAIQHEHDHLQGKLFIDGLTAAERAEIKDELAAIAEKHHPGGVKK
jgi:peptide deformylase